MGTESRGSALLSDNAAREAQIAKRIAEDRADRLQEQLDKVQAAERAGSPTQGVSGQQHQINTALQQQLSEMQNELRRTQEQAAAEIAAAQQQRDAMLIRQQTSREQFTDQHLSAATVTSAEKK